MLALRLFCAIRFGSKSVDTLDVPNGSALRVHHDRVRPRGIAEEPDSPDKVAVRNSGRDKHQMLARRQIVDHQDAVQIPETHRSRPLRFFFVTWFQAAHEATAQ